MKARTWNIGMLAAFVIIAAISGFFAVADDFSLGDFDDFSSGDFDDFSFGDFDDFSFGDIDDLHPGDFDDQQQEGATDQGAAEDTGGFDPFDDDFGPLDNIPGNPAGTDFPPVPEEMPVIPPVIPPVTPTPSPSPESKDYLRIFIHNIFMNNPFDEQPGDQVALRITFENTGTKKLENTKVIVGIPDLAVKASFGPLDLGKGEKATATAYLELPEDTMPGVYPVRIQIYNENTQRIVHREIEVIDYS
ncbi:MAG: NEW3 domain-containing protein [Candidatus Woesearchaeota archaeon]